MDRRCFAIALALLLPALALAQTDPTATSPRAQQLVMLFVDDSSVTATGGGLVFIDDKGVPHSFGVMPYVEPFSVPVGWTIRTGKCSVELQLLPNKSIIKLVEGSTLNVKELAGGAGGGSVNAFAVLSGRIRLIAAKGSYNSYSLNSQSAICLVRGTDFTFDAGIDGSTFSQVFVQEGAVFFAKLEAEIDPLSAFEFGQYNDPSSSKGIYVYSGETADAFAATLTSRKMNGVQLAKLTEMKIWKLDVTGVPGHFVSGD